MAAEEMDMDEALKRMDKVHEIMENLKDPSLSKEEKDKFIDLADKMLKEEETNKMKTVFSKTNIPKQRDPNQVLIQF